MEAADLNHRQFLRMDSGLTMIGLTTVGLLRALAVVVFGLGLANGSHSSSRWICLHYVQLTCACWQPHLGDHRKHLQLPVTSGPILGLLILAILVEQRVDACSALSQVGFAATPYCVLLLTVGCYVPQLAGCGRPANGRHVVCERCAQCEVRDLDRGRGAGQCSVAGARNGR